MYLEKSRKRFNRLVDLLNQHYEETHFSHRCCSWSSCTFEEIIQLKHFLNLSLPKAYEEFLLWMGKGCNVLESYGGHYSTKEVNLQELGHEIMEADESRETLPEDAIVIWLFDESTEFAFIRASEGDNPPIHHFGAAVEGGYPLPNSTIQWNWYPNLDELLLALINDYISMRRLE
jgi:hypothetical protein